MLYNKIMYNNKRIGFTLIEITVVIVILGILASLSVADFIKIKARVRQSIMKDKLTEIWNNEQLFYGQYGHFGPGPDRRFNIAYYKNGKHRKGDTLSMHRKGPNLNVRFMKSDPYYYYIYWFNRPKRNISYCYIAAIGNIDNDPTLDYRYIYYYQHGKYKVFRERQVINDLYR